jgi:hypothetical protein
VFSNSNQSSDTTAWTCTENGRMFENWISPLKKERGKEQRETDRQENKPGKQTTNGHSFLFHNLKIYLGEETR